MAKNTDPFQTDQNTPTITPDQRPDLGGIAPAPMDAEDPELSAVKSGKMKPYQVSSPTARRAAYDWHIQQRQPRLGNPAATYQQSAPLDQWNTTRGMNATVAGAVPTDAPNLWNNGGFIDPNAGNQIESVRSGAIRPDEIQNPTVRASVYAALQNDPEFAADFRRNRRARVTGEGVRADPNVMAGAQAEIDATAGTGQPHQATEADAQRRRIERHHEDRTNSQAMRAAKAIARSDPKGWDKAITNYNRQNAGKSFLRREDIVASTARQETRPAGGFGTYGEAPPVIGGRASGGSAMARGQGSPDVIETSYGAHRIQRVGDAMKAVPVIKSADGSIIPDAGNLSRGDFDSVLSPMDAGRIKSLIYASGQNEWIGKARKVDSAYAALGDDTLSDTERQQAEVALRDAENDLLYRFVRSNGASLRGTPQAMGGGGQQGMGTIQTGDPQKDAAEANRIGRDNPDMSDDEIRRYMDDVRSGRPVPVLRGGRGSGEKPDFDANNFVGNYTKTRDALAKGDEKAGKASGLGGGSGGRPKTGPEISQEAFRRTFAEAGGMNADVPKHSREASSAIKAAVTAIRTGQTNQKFAKSMIRKVVIDHLPAFYDQLGSPDDIENDDVMRQIVAETLNDDAAAEDIFPSIRTRTATATGKPASTGTARPAPSADRTYMNSGNKQ